MASLAQAAVVEVRTFWYCPNCGHEDTTTQRRPHTRFHVCPSLQMMQAPLLPKGVRAKVVAHEREDYIGTRQLVRRDANGRPIMSITVTRDDGEDTIVFAPTALARIS